MKRLLALSATAIGVALLAAQPTHAAFLSICDAAACGSASPNITISANDFEGGLQLNGAVIQSGLGNPTTTVYNEGTGPNLIDGAGENDFAAVWQAPGGVTATNQTIFFIDPSNPSEDGTTAVSDALHFTYTQSGINGHLDATFISDVEGQPLTIASLHAAGIDPTGTFDERLGAFGFSNTNLTASAQSDVDVAVPEPASAALLGSALIGMAFGFRRRTRKLDRDS
jgi:PEP-CTERM motif-containing protein